VWARNGSELFYVTQGRDMTVAELDLSGDLRVLRRDALFNLNELGLFAQANYAGYDVGLDDQQLFMVQFGSATNEEMINEFVLVQNWLTEVEGRLPQ
jgi:hypothetical protein